MLAVLEEAITTFQKFAFARSLRGQNFFREADRWIRAEDDEWFFSFNNICDLLGFDPAWIRTGLTKWKTEAQTHPGPIKPANIRRIAGKRFALLGIRRSSPRMRVMALTIGPRTKVNLRPAGKWSGHEYDEIRRGAPSRERSRRKDSRCQKPDQSIVT